MTEPNQQRGTPRTDAARSKCRSLDDLYGCQPLERCARTLERELSALTAQLAEARRDAERYRWLRDRMQVRHEEAMSGKTKEALSMRIGFSFLDCTSDPYKGWTDVKYFDEQRQKLDAAIDAALQESKK